MKKIKLKTKKDFKQAVKVMNLLIDFIGENESHVLCSLLELVGNAVSEYEVKHILKHGDD